MSWLHPPRDRAEALLWRTRMRLALVTMVMVTTLVIIVGISTAVVAIALMRESIDRALDAAASDPLTLHELLEDEEEYEYAGPLGEADTFVMLVDAEGNVYGNTTDAELTGLPDMTAIERATQGHDRRSGSYGETDLRLLTIRYGVAEVEEILGDDMEDDLEGTTTLYLQAGHDMSLEQQLERQLLLAIGLIGLLGVAGAVAVTLFVTRRALVPIREAFETERRFVAAASHELRTPISIIRASAEIIEREDLVGPPGRPLLEDIIGETDRMGRLVGDLMSLATAEAGAISLHLEPVPLGEYFTEIARRSSSIAESRGLHLEATAASIPPEAIIRADRDRLDQLLLILVDNATRHSPAGGTIHMTASTDAAAGTATVSVSDDGPGIHTDEQERIFEPFTRTGGRNANSDGAGLGLAIARQLAGRHDAELVVESPVAAGATFSLRLPLSERPGGRS